MTEHRVWKKKITDQKLIFHRLQRMLRNSNNMLNHDSTL